jgi:hypothetical protein
MPRSLAWTDLCLRPKRKVCCRCTSKPAAVVLAEKGNLDEAISIFTSIVAAHPRYGSALNNRAQAYLLKHEPDLALADVNAVLALPHAADALRSRAFIQKSMILRLKGDEEGARVCMESAAGLGDELARMEAVKMNPYAAMCNAMLASAASSLQG